MSLETTNATEAPNAATMIAGTVNDSIKETPHAIGSIEVTKEGDMRILFDGDLTMPASQQPAIGAVHVPANHDPALITNQIQNLGPYVTPYQGKTHVAQPGVPAHAGNHRNALSSQASDKAVKDLLDALNMNAGAPGHNNAGAEYNLPHKIAGGESSAAYQRMVENSREGGERQL